MSYYVFDEGFSEMFEVKQDLNGSGTVTLNEHYEGRAWREQKAGRNGRPAFNLVVPIGLTNGVPMRIYSHLGKIKQKNDGRWDYFLFKQRDMFPKYNNGVTTQGVAKTKEEAMLFVERGMNLPTLPTETEKQDLAPA